MAIVEINPGAGNASVEMFTPDPANGTILPWAGLIPGKIIDPSAFIAIIDGGATEITSAVVALSGELINITLADTGATGSIIAYPGHPALVGKNGWQCGGGFQVIV